MRVFMEAPTVISYEENCIINEQNVQNAAELQESGEFSRLFPQESKGLAF